MNFDVIIVGGGILGFSVAMQLKQSDPTMRVAVIEKEYSIAQHQTGHNSSERTLHVCNAPSPAATSCLPVGKYILTKFEDSI